MSFRKKKKQHDEEELEIMDLMEDMDLSEPDGLSEKPPKKKLPGWVIVPIIAGVAVAGIGISALIGDGDNPSASQNLSVVEVKKESIKEVYNSSGTIESENTKTYYSPVTAPIANLNAKVGQIVQAGDLLVTFDTTNLERDNQQAQLNLQSAYNTSQAARDKNAQAIDAANAANAELANQANALADQVNALKAQMDAAKATYDANATANASAETQTRIAELQGQIADLNTQIQNYQNTIQTLSVVYEGSGKTYSEAVATPEDKRTDAQKKLISDIDTYNAAVAELPNAQASLAATESELTALNTVDDAGYAALAAQYESAYAQWEAAYNAANAAASQPSAGMSSAEMNNLTISDNLAELAAMSQSELLEKAREGMKADMNGVIASVEVLQTNAAAQGAAVFSIASTENVRVKVDISPDDYEKMTVGTPAYEKMTVGTPATITIGEHKYEGTLENVNRIATNNAKGNPVIGAQIHISNPDEYICIGATAKVSMTVAQSDNVLTVPIECINTSTSGDFVFVIENGTVKKKPVELGTASTTAIEVKSGLKEGDQVVNDLNVDVTEGMKATAVPSTDTTTPKDAASEKQEDTKKQTDSEKQDAPSADK
ncbi:HlyD family efflux transporter periplasmic adaptor subunit [Mediterraneibacter glycyrrhizinilyticus]|nr:HlyD family efflux transporter periplasmic adaptor subunit [Mediterraneibacter glycyrrhizinilyticus]MCB6308332.1 HlyD family efflux transporter periplasmic adaptor subunit [Lachnospiraceae bacterium 210521-DFI.1.109]MCB6426636.1 HlyD family efflux transporter periplasmic adaptor subunit [Mediterraneibacter glycyrrhizinilyticus]